MTAVLAQCQICWPPLISSISIKTSYLRLGRMFAEAIMKRFRSFKHIDTMIHIGIHIGVAQFCKPSNKLQELYPAMAGQVVKSIVVSMYLCI
jgi:hypothetical protein